MSELSKPTLTSLMFACTAALTLSSLSAHAQIPCRYDVQIISAGPCSIFGPQPTFGMGINSNGDICGWHCACVCAKYDRAFLRTEGGGFLTLSLPPGIAGAEAYDVNDALQVVGTMDNIPAAGQHGFVWQHGQWTELAPTGGGFHSGAFAINNTGQVVGYRDLAHSTRHAFLWSQGKFTDIPPVLGPTSLATDVNDSGIVVGWMGVGVGIDSHPFLWDHGDVADLGLPAGAFAAQATAINNLNELVGVSDMSASSGSGSIAQAFYWRNGRFHDLGVLPGFLHCVATDVNDAGHVVGYCTTTGSFNHAFIWQNGQMTDLNNLIDAQLGLIVLEAHGINQTDRIVGTARLSSHDIVAVILTAVQPSIADLTGDCHTDVHDLTILLDEWGKPGSPADLNSDGTVDTLDLGILLVNWSMIS